MQDWNQADEEEEEEEDIGLERKNNAEEDQTHTNYAHENDQE
jgi:hypothetical protein